MQGRSRGRLCTLRRCCTSGAGNALTRRQQPGELPAPGGAQEQALRGGSVLQAAGRKEGALRGECAACAAKLRGRSEVRQRRRGTDGPLVLARAKSVARSGRSRRVPVGAPECQGRCSSVVAAAAHGRVGGRLR